MKFVSYIQDGKILPGVLKGERVCPLSALGYEQIDLQSFIAQSDLSDVARIRSRLDVLEGIPLEQVRLTAPIPEPLQEVIIMENNYCSTEQMAAEKRAQAASGILLPTYYYKKATLATTTGDSIPRYPGFLSQLDFQVELVAVLCRPDAPERIFGYTVINNVIAHDVTVRHRRPYLATSLDGFLPMAPYIVSADEFEPGHCFCLRSYVNGEMCQAGSTRQQIFSPEYAIADLSRAGVLYGASLLSTGTPLGTLRDTGRPFLEPGDVVRCEVDGIGDVTCIVK